MVEKETEKKDKKFTKIVQKNLEFISSTRPGAPSEMTRFFVKSDRAPRRVVEKETKKKDKKFTEIVQKNLKFISTTRPGAPSEMTLFWSNLIWRHDAW